MEKGDWRGAMRTLDLDLNSCFQLILDITDQWLKSDLCVRNNVCVFTYLKLRSKDTIVCTPQAYVQIKTCLNSFKLYIYKSQIAVVLSFFLLLIVYSLVLNLQDYQLRCSIYRCLLQLCDLLSAEQLIKIDLECFRFGDFLFQDDTLLVPLFLVLMSKVCTVPLYTQSDVRVSYPNFCFVRSFVFIKFI